MKTFYESGMRKRVLFIAAFFLAWALVVFFRLIDLQVLRHEQCENMVYRQNQDKKKAEPERGTIYDRNGQILACTLPAPNVYICPVEKEKPAGTAARVTKLRSVLGLSDREAAQIMSRLEKNYTFTYAKKRVSKEEATAVKAMKLDGVGFEPSTKRFYPLGSLASHILGGVNNLEKGISGVESKYDTLLRGEEGEQIVSVDSRRREYQAQIVKPAVRGKDIYLTIDVNIQHIAESELQKAVEEHGADWGTVIIMEPKSGDILALANFPGYDPNSYPRDPGLQSNRAVMYNYAPGSTFKIVSAAAALESGVVDFNDVFDCRSGSVKAGPLTITDAHHLGVLSFPQVIIESSNVGTVLFARRMDPKAFYEKIRAFGFGRKTGIDLPGEEPGLVWPFNKWNPKISLPYISIGYELMVTPIQVLEAMNVYAASGLLVRPHVVLRTSADAAKAAEGPAAPERAIKETTARDLVERALEKVVEEGTGKLGRLDGYDIAGKTGTAQKVDPTTGGYTTRRHIASFVGFVPAGNPALTMMVVLDEPKEGFYYGGQVCGPIFRDIARKVLRYMGVAPTRPFKDKVVTADGGGKKIARGAGK